MTGKVFAAVGTLKGSGDNRGQQAAAGFEFSAYFAARKVETATAIAVEAEVLKLLST